MDYDRFGTATNPGVRAVLEIGKENITKTDKISVDDITYKNYGQYVDIGTNIVSTKETLIDGTLPKADWRVFKKDDNGVLLILADYLPNDAFDVSTVGCFTTFTDSRRGYMVKATDGSRLAIINALNSSNWINLINGSYVINTNGVYVKGAPTLEEWVGSWNANSGYTTIYTAKATSPMDDGLYGNYVGSTQNPTTCYLNLSTEPGRSNTLYFPKPYQYYYTQMYYLISPDPATTWTMQYIDAKGSIGDSTNVVSDGYAVRPIVYLPNSVKLDKSGEVWTIN